MAFSSSSNVFIYETTVAVKTAVNTRLFCKLVRSGSFLTNIGTR